MPRIGQNQYIKQAANIIEELLKLEKEFNAISTPNLNQLQSLCQQYVNFEEKFFKEQKIRFTSLKRKRNIQALVKKNENVSALVQYLHDQQQEYFLLADYYKTLSIILSGFQSVFNKVIGNDFVQQFIIEGEDFTPIIIEANSFVYFQQIFTGQVNNYRHRIQSNQEVLSKYQKLINKRYFHVVSTSDKYQETYKEVRRRVQISNKLLQRSDKVKSFQAILLYKRSGSWIKRYINNLGDLKQAYGAMVAAYQLPMISLQERVGYFADHYISKVDSVEGTIAQDYFENRWDDTQGLINRQISAKSSKGRQGSYQNVISLIRNIASVSSPAEIRNIILNKFNMDLAAQQQGKGRRNLEKSISQIAQIFNQNEEKVREQIIPEYIKQI